MFEKYLQKQKIDNDLFVISNHLNPIYMIIFLFNVKIADAANQQF